MTIAAADLYRTPNALAPHYSRFDVANRLLLTGHSHQAWPDRAFDGQMQAWLDAARYVDEKWEQAFARADRVRLGYARLLDDVGGSRGSITLAESTHELLVRLLSALPLRERPRLVTTTAEFHTIRRQLDRLEEEGIEIVRIDADPVPDLAARLAAAVDDRTAAILVSSVFFLSARIVPGLGEVMAACRRVGAELVVDVYHHLNVVPFSLRAEGLEEAYVVGGGYKYCQLGEGNAFLRVPRDCKLRPVITGWFSEFSAIATAGGQRATPYGTGADRFAGATYDPTSNYRAAAVFDFFDEHALPPTLLREVSQHQVGLLAAGFDALDLDPALVDRDRDVDLSEIGGFLALRSPRAGDLCAGLRERGVMADYRGDVLRLGPAPYLSDAQLEDAVAALGESAAAAGRSATLGRSATTLSGDAEVVDAGAARR
jgi:selenocysteine lyase/cysteine desulfurase